MGVEGKRFRPTVILLTATALNVEISKQASEGVVDMFSTELRLRQQSIAEITEMIHKTYYKTASLISNSCKSIALVTGQTAEVAMLAYEYGKNLEDHPVCLLVHQHETPCTSQPCVSIRGY